MSKLGTVEACKQQLKTTFHDWGITAAIEDAELVANAGLETNTWRKNPAAVVNENHAEEILLAMGGSARESRAYAVAWQGRA